jgi:hypothetical protein
MRSGAISTGTHTYLGGAFGMLENERIFSRKLRVPGEISMSEREKAPDPILQSIFTTFTLGDVSRVPLPVGVDLALCRDALQHLPMSEAVRLLRNLAAARPKHVLLGSYSSEHSNVKINVGD